MMYCPECGSRYPDGSTRCRNCRTALTGESEAAARALDVVAVLQTSDRIQLALAKGLLVDAGIPFLLNGQISTLIQDVDGLLHKWISVEVPRSREVEAREILEPLLHPTLYPVTD